MMVACGGGGGGSSPSATSSVLSSMWTFESIDQLARLSGMVMTDSMQVGIAFRHCNEIMLFEST